MFMLKSIGKILSGSKPKHDIATIPYGELYLIRPSSPKSYSECIFKDAAAVITKTDNECNYQLVIQRAYDEGEDHLNEDTEEDSESAGDSKALDHKVFQLTRDLEFRVAKNENTWALAWRDLEGDENDTYEFIIDSEVPETLIAEFELLATKSVIGNENKSNEPKYTPEKLDEVRSDKEIPQFSLRSESLDLLQHYNRSTSSNLEDPEANPEVESESTKPSGEKTDDFCQPREQNDLDTMCKDIPAKLFLFDPFEEIFLEQDPSVLVAVLDAGNFQYWLDISSRGADEKKWIQQLISYEMNANFSFEHKSFIWNFFDQDQNAFSWLLRFESDKILEDFQAAYMQAIWETQNQQKWAKIKPQDQEYVFEAFENDEEMSDYHSSRSSDNEEDRSGSDREVQENDYDDEDNVENLDDSFESFTEDNNDENSHLAVGRATDRTFVLRGNKIGVFKSTRGNKLSFSATIDNISTPTGATFTPSHAMLHERDHTMILRGGNENDRLYKMDVERGKVVEEWKLHDDIPLVAYAPESKYAQTTDEQTFIGIGHNSVYRIDPRLPTTKLVESQYKQYTTKNDFSSVATTKEGWLAVASDKGDIRLFDRIGINAKTALPALGEPITGLDVTADGRWVLATCKTYLLLVDTTIKEGKYAGQVGFQKSFSKDSKPRPKRLQLNPNHIAMMQNEFKKRDMKFTPAKFNQGPNISEKQIVTSIGPYVISWDFSQVKGGKLNNYKIRRYAEDVKADDFQFGTDENVIVALKNDVSMIGKQSLQSATRKSLCTPVKNLRSYNSIVNSPF